MQYSLRRYPRQTPSNLAAWPVAMVLAISLGVIPGKSSANVSAGFGPECDAAQARAKEQITAEGLNGPANGAYDAAVKSKQTYRIILDKIRGVCPAGVVSYYQGLYNKAASSACGFSAAASDDCAIENVPLTRTTSPNQTSSRHVYTAEAVRQMPRGSTVAMDEECIDPLKKEANRYGIRLAIDQDRNISIPSSNAVTAQETLAHLYIKSANISSNQTCIDRYLGAASSFFHLSELNKQNNIQRARAEAEEAERIAARQAREAAEEDEEEHDNDEEYVNPYSGAASAIMNGLMQGYMQGRATSQHNYNSGPSAGSSRNRASDGSGGDNGPCPVPGDVRVNGRCPAR